MIHLCVKTTSLSCSTETRKVKKSTEASATHCRNYAKQFGEAKVIENKSWVDNEVFDLVDWRTLSPKEKLNYVTGDGS